MVLLNEAIDYVWMFLIAGGLGAVGGIAYELLQVRAGRRDTGCGNRVTSLIWDFSRA